MSAVHEIPFAELKARAQFGPVLERYNVEFTRKGHKLVARCPFHHDHTPSLKIEPYRGTLRFHCFGCKAKGDIIDFVKRIANVRSPEAAAIIADACGLSFPTQHPAKCATSPVDVRKPAGTGNASSAPPKGSGGAHTSSGGRFQANGNGALGYRLTLDPLHPYPADRGLSPATIATFGLGLANRGYFSGFVCIPLVNAGGELVGYAGRWPDDAAVEAGQVEKYRLPPKFRKLELLYNVQRVAGRKHVVIVEGFWSVFRLHELGIPAVALMGTTLSPTHINLLRGAGVRFATVMLDGDEPGQKGASEAVPLLAAEGFWVCTVVLPAGEQPDTVAQEFLDQHLHIPVSEKARR